jgi:hypothetical protein
VPGGRVIGAIPKSQVRPGRRGRRTAGIGLLSHTRVTVPRATASGRWPRSDQLPNPNQDHSRLDRSSGTKFLFCLDVEVRAHGCALTSLALPGINASPMAFANQLAMQRSARVLNRLMQCDPTGARG